MKANIFSPAADVLPNQFSFNLSSKTLSVPCKDISGKVVFINNADTALGREIALQFASCGAHMVLAYSHDEHAASHTSELIEKTGRHFILLQGNIEEEKSCENLVKKALMKFGQLHILINHIHQFIQPSISAGFHLVKTALQYMKSGSSIINSVSQTGLTITDLHDTAADVMDFTIKIRQLLAHPSIRITGIAPFSCAALPGDTSLAVAEVAPIFPFIASEKGTILNDHLLYLCKKGDTTISQNYFPRKQAHTLI